MNSIKIACSIILIPSFCSAIFFKPALTMFLILSGATAVEDTCLRLREDYHYQCTQLQDELMKMSCSEAQSPFICDNGALCTNGFCHSIHFLAEMNIDKYERALKENNCVDEPIFFKYCTPTIGSCTKKSPLTCLQELKDQSDPDDNTCQIARKKIQEKCTFNYGVSVLGLAAFLGAWCSCTCNFFKRYRANQICAS